MKTPRIDSFSGEYRFLSNFWPCELWYNGIRYPSSEHAYQAAKYEDFDHHNEVRAAKSPGEAKKLGQKYPKREGWELEKVQVMEDILICKFYQNRDLRNRLMETGTLPLIEGNTWGDRFWGVCSGVGYNMLGRILERVRAKLIEDTKKEEE